MGTPVLARHAAPAYPPPVDLPPLQPVLDAIHRRVDPSGVARPYVVDDQPAGIGGDRPGEWISGAELTDGSQLSRLLNGPTVRWGAASHAAAALAWKAYTYWLVLPAVSGLVRLGRVPLLPADNVLVRLSYQPPFVTVGLRRPAIAVLHDDPYAADPGAVVVDHPDELLGMFAESLGRHIRQLAEATRDQVRIGARTLSGSLAASVGFALRFTAEAFGDTTAVPLTATPTSPPERPGAARPPANGTPPPGTARSTSPSEVPAAGLARTGGTVRPGGGTSRLRDDGAARSGDGRTARLAAAGEAVLGALGVPDLVELDEQDGAVEVRRRTCCLAFTVPGLQTCATCCIPR